MRSAMLERLGHRLAQRVMSRKPDQIIGPPADPYLLRWRLWRKGWWPNIYVHCFLRSDDARALHDHPTDNISLILSGKYLEVFEEGQIEKRGNGLHTIIHMGHREVRLPGDIVFRRAETPHRVVLFDSLTGPQPCVTLFICGPRRRDWLFHCPGGKKVRWQDFVKITPDGNEMGKGCEQ